MNTKGGMKKSRMKVDNIRQKRASLLTKDGIEYGYRCRGVCELPALFHKQCEELMCQMHP